MSMASTSATWGRVRRRQASKNVALARSVLTEGAATDHLGRQPTLVTQGVAAAARQIEMEMVAVHLIGLRPQHRAEHAAGALVQPVQEVGLGTRLGIGALRAARCRNGLGIGADVGDGLVVPLQSRGFARGSYVLLLRGRCLRG